MAKHSCNFLLFVDIFFSFLSTFSLLFVDISLSTSSLKKRMTVLGCDQKAEDGKYQTKAAVGI